MKHTVPRIALCGAHGTGKTTIATILSQHYEVQMFGSLRSRWSDYGVADFEKLPRDIRTQFQLKMINSQIVMENTNWDQGFITDRSVLDYLAYTLVSSDMAGDLKEIFMHLVRDRMNRYTHVLYFPIEFKAHNEPLRADMSSQSQIDTTIKTYLDQFRPHDYLTMTGGVEQRTQRALEFVDR